MNAEPYGHRMHQYTGLLEPVLLAGREPTKSAATHAHTHTHTHKLGKRNAFANAQIKQPQTAQGGSTCVELRKLGGPQQLQRVSRPRCSCKLCETGPLQTSLNSEGKVQWSKGRGSLQRAACSGVSGRPGPRRRSESLLLSGFEGL